jgi:hypothetical protein
VTERIGLGLRRALGRDLLSRNLGLGLGLRLRLGRNLDGESFGERRRGFDLIVEVFARKACVLGRLRLFERRFGFRLDRRFLGAAQPGQSPRGLLRLHGLRWFGLRLGLLDDGLGMRIGDGLGKRLRMRLRTRFS